MNNFINKVILYSMLFLLFISFTGSATAIRCNNDFFDDYFCTTNITYSEFEPDGDIFDLEYVWHNGTAGGTYPALNISNMSLNSSSSWARLNYSVVVPSYRSFNFYIHDGFYNYSNAYSEHFEFDGVDVLELCNSFGWDECYAEMEPGTHNISLIVESNYAYCPDICVFYPGDYFFIEDMVTEAAINYQWNSITNDNSASFSYSPGQSFRIGVNVTNTRIEEYRVFELVEGSYDAIGISLDGFFDVSFEDGNHTLVMNPHNGVGSGDDAIWEISPRLLSSNAKFISNSDVEIYFWDILFLASMLYIATFFVTLGDKR